MTEVKELPIIAFSSVEKFETWLSKNHESAKGLWIHFYKKDSGKKSITYKDALDAALCYGWIDGHVRAYDDISWIHKFTPRRPKGKWSKKNKENVARLITEKRIKPAGQKEIDAAKKDGRWDDAYDSPSTSTVPEDFLKLLEKNKKAKEFFATLNKANIYAITYRLQTAKKLETREKRMQLIFEMMKKGEKFH